MKPISFGLLLLCLGAGCATVGTSAGATSKDATTVDAGRTHWVLEPNEAYDALCLINLLRGDDFYLKFLPEPYQRWSPLLGDAEKAALKHVTLEMVTKGKDLPSAKLTLVFSALPVRTTHQLLEAVNSDASWATIKKTHLARPDTEANEFDDVDAVRGDLRLLLGWLEAQHFSDVWRSEELPKIQKAIASTAGSLHDADVVGWDEQVLGRPLGVDALDTEFLAFVRPHGIRVNGWRFLTDAALPVAITEKTALHELLHPPYVRAGALQARLEKLESDPFFQRLLKEHDPSFGYVDAHGFTEEDCAEAIDVFNSERHGLLRGPDGKPIDGAHFFALHDDGFHVPAFLIYRELTKADWAHWDGYEAFLIRFFDQTPSLEARFRAEPASYPVKALHEH